MLFITFFDMETALPLVKPLIQPAFCISKNRTEIQHSSFIAVPA